MRSLWTLQSLTIGMSAYRLYEAIGSESVLLVNYYRHRLIIPISNLKLITVTFCNSDARKELQIFTTIKNSNINNNKKCSFFVVWGHFQMN